MSRRRRVAVEVVERPDLSRPMSVYSVEQLTQSIARVSRYELAILDLRSAGDVVIREASKLCEILYHVPAEVQGHVLPLRDAVNGWRAAGDRCCAAVLGEDPPAPPPEPKAKRRRAARRGRK